MRVTPGSALTNRVNVGSTMYRARREGATLAGSTLSTRSIRFPRDYSRPMAVPQSAKTVRARAVMYSVSNQNAPVGLILAME